MYILERIDVSEALALKQRMQPNVVPAADAVNVVREALALDQRMEPVACGALAEGDNGIIPTSSAHL